MRFVFFSALFTVDQQIFFRTLFFKYRVNIILKCNTDMMFPNESFISQPLALSCTLGLAQKEDLGNRGLQFIFFDCTND